MSASEFWAQVAAKALRPDGGVPSWVSENLRSHVSIGLRHVPGNPDHRPRRDDHPDDQETTR